MNKLFKLDWILLLSILFLLALGLVSLYSVSFQGAIGDFTNFKKQLISAVLGLGLMFFFSSYDYRILNSISTKLYFAGLIILLAVILWGSTIRGTTGWIGFGSFHIQPVEIAKLIMIIFLASFLSKKKDQLGLATRTFVSVILVFLPVFLILKQPDLGSAMIIIGFWVVMLVLSDVNKKNLAVLALLGVVAVTSAQFFLKDYQKERIVNFIRPENDPQGSGYNVLQSIIAVGSGGVFGKGLGHGSQSQLNFLPEKHTDFIFAVVAEELGLFGAVIVFVLFGVVFWRMREIARYSRDNFGCLLVVGISSMLFFQFLINIGMNIGVMPVAGVPLPFLSYGGSSLVVVLASIGIVQSVYIHHRFQSFS
jgi:rod shape determining protein RodA